MRLAIALIAFSATLGAACAQDNQTEPEKYPFEGGTLTITQESELDKVLAYDGKELTRNYVVVYDRTVQVAGLNVAMFFVGEGGNACPPSSFLVWKPEGGDLKTQMVGDECGSPSPAATPDEIYFVPYVLPGETETVETWTPDRGLEEVGALTFAPRRGSSWKSFDPGKLRTILDAMKNADVFKASRKLLGNKLGDVVTSLTVSGDAETTSSGVVWGMGCIPHNCGGNDGFMAVDAKQHRVYFAQQPAGSEPAAWPPLSAWPKDLRDVMVRALNGE